MRPITRWAVPLSLLAFAYLDFGITYWCLKHYPPDVFAEGNLIIDFYIQYFDSELVLLVILPAIIAFMAVLLFQHLPKFWHKTWVRVVIGLLILRGIFLVAWNAYGWHAIHQILNSSS